MNYGKAIRIARALADIPQRELARRVNIDSSLISLLEAGKRQPSREMLEKLSANLNIPFHLFVLLASEVEDTRSASAETLQQLATELARLLLHDNDHEKQKPGRSKTTQSLQRKTSETTSRKQ